jgi:hypothetical protein
MDDMSLREKVITVKSSASFLAKELPSGLDAPKTQNIFNWSPLSVQAKELKSAHLHQGILCSWI